MGKRIKHQRRQVSLFNGQVVLKRGTPDSPPCFHGIRQTAQADCECGCKSIESLGIAQDTGDRNVDLRHGEFTLHVVDLQIPGRGLTWKFERTYRSRITFDGPLGHNWEFNYNRRLFICADGAVIRMDGYGRADRYELLRGRYKAPVGFYTRLVRNKDRTFTEQDRGRTEVVYSAPDDQGIARMIRLRDRNRNQMRFKYNAQGQLIQVIDTLGRLIAYRHNADGRLVEVEDFVGRTIRFEYDADGNLAAMTSPAVTETPTGNNFPAGKTTRYRYSSGFSDERLDHSLVDIVAPNEVVTDGSPRINVEYDADTASPNVGRVLRQTIGGVNAHGIPAGGKISYTYRALRAAKVRDLKTPVHATTVTNRNGNRCEYQFNQAGNIIRNRKFTNRNIRSGDQKVLETRFEYNRDGEVTRVVHPEGNSNEYVYDERNPDRLRQGNLLAEKGRPDRKRGGDQQVITTSYTYEPIYNQRRRVTEARGKDPAYVPPDGGSHSPARDTTVYIFDYQEGKHLAALAPWIGVSVGEVRTLLRKADIPIGLGDVNGDGQTRGLAGNVVKVIYPTVSLLPDSRMASIERGVRQSIEETLTYNRCGQITHRRDPEGNLTLYTYYPENDPEGGGKTLTPGVGDGPFGYLKQEIRDAQRSRIRNSWTNPAPAMIKRRYFYDRVGNVIKEIDGRGIATEYAVNRLNQVVQITRATDVAGALRNPKEPKWRAATDQSLVECAKGMVAFKYRTRILYDHNNNVIKREIENRDLNNPELTGDWISQGFKYDILDNLIERTREVSSSTRGVLVTRYRYDRNTNRVLEISPVATLPAEHEQSKPSNVVSHVFDERDLLFTSTRGGLTDQFRSLQAHADLPELNSVPNSPDISTVSIRYDGNRNRVEVTGPADQTGDDKPRSTAYLYDGFDRRVSVIDAVGNQSFARYDAAGNVLRVSSFGPVGGPSPRDKSGANFRQPLRLEDFRQPCLMQVELKYDEIGRLFERNEKLFVSNGVTYLREPVLTDGPLGQVNDGWVTTRYEYDRKNRRTFVITDNLSVVETRYDGVDRIVHKIDPELNEVRYTYDDNGNVISVVEIDRTPRRDVGAGKVLDLRENFTTMYVYDSLNRLIRTTDNVGQTTRYHYDGRDNLILASDGQHSKNSTDLIADPLKLFPVVGQDSRGARRINRPGNTREYFYDGLNRKIRAIRHLRVDGQGKNPIDTRNPSNPDGVIVTHYEWDTNSRLVAIADDGSLRADQNTSFSASGPKPSGNITRYRYDDLNRLRQEIFHDGTIKDYTYDLEDNVIRMIDQNGSIITKTHDRINRRVRRQITPATSDTPHPAGGFKDPNITWAVVGTTLQEFEYDGLSRMTRSVDDNQPNGPDEAATVIYSYDSLSRLLEERQDDYAVSSRWSGGNTRTGVVYPNGRELRYTADKLGRIHTISDKGATRPIVEYQYIGPRRVLERTFANGVRLTYLDETQQKDVGYDRRGRVVLHQHLRQDNSVVVGFAYAYDRADHKIFEIRQHHKERREDYAYDSLYRLVRAAGQGETEDTWQLDGVGNWVGRRGVANYANNVNEYTSFGGVRLLHDDNGNLIDDGRNCYQYDFANRLRRVIRKADNAVIAVYRYDAHNRRIGRLVTNTQNFDEKVRYLYDGWREIEERRDGSSQQYVYGMWIDEPLTLDKASNKDGVVEQSFFYHQDRKTHVAALTNGAAKVVEQVSYDAYGRPGSRTSSVRNPYLFNGRRYDPETQLYYYRARFYDPERGRFLQRDPLGIWADEGSLGNGYTFVGNDPVNGKDPRGLLMTLDQCGLWTDFDQEGGGPYGIYQPGVGCVGGECSQVVWGWEQGYHFNPRLGGESGYGGDSGNDTGCFSGDGDRTGDGDGPGDGSPPLCQRTEQSIDSMEEAQRKCFACGLGHGSTWFTTDVNEPGIGTCTFGNDDQWICDPAAGTCVPSPCGTPAGIPCTDPKTGERPAMVVVAVATALTPRSTVGGSHASRHGRGGAAIHRSRASILGSPVLNHQKGCPAGC